MKKTVYVKTLGAFEPNSAENEFKNGFLSVTDWDILTESNDKWWFSNVKIIMNPQVFTLGFLHDAANVVVQVGDPMKLQKDALDYPLCFWFNLNIRFSIDPSMMFAKYLYTSGEERHKSLPVQIDERVQNGKIASPYDLGVFLGLFVADAINEESWQEEKRKQEVQK